MQAELRVPQGLAGDGGWNWPEGQGEVAAGCPFGRSQRWLSYHGLGPNSRKEKRWEGQKKELGGNGGTGERVALGTPR